jgi:hypothetical protein
MVREVIAKNAGLNVDPVFMTPFGIGIFPRASILTVGELNCHCVFVRENEK